MINQQRGLNKQGREGAISLRSLIIAEFQLQMTVTILTNNQIYNLAQQSTASVGDMMVVHLQVSDGGIGQRRHRLDLFVHLFVCVSSCFLVGY